MSTRVDGTGVANTGMIQSSEPTGAGQAQETPQPAEKPPTLNTDHNLDHSSRVTEHSLVGQMQAAYLHAQLDNENIIRNPAKITQPAPKTSDSPQTAPPVQSMQTILTNTGMKGVHNPPTDAELKTYYATKAPAKDLIAKRDYAAAAAEYRKVAAAESNPAEKQRLNQVAEQLDVVQSMNNAKVRDLSFPPSQANLEAYFGTMKGKPLSEIKSSYQKYADAFFVHSEKPGVDRGDVVYTKNNYNRDGKTYESRAPQNWNDVTNKRDIHSDGRRIIDCEGYALIGQKCLAAAGFKPVEFSVMSRKDDPQTTDDESFTKQHIMVSGSRTIKENGVKKTEIAVISNGTVYSDSKEKDKNFNLNQLQNQTLVYAYGDTYREVSGKLATIPGGLLVTRGDNVTAEFDLLQILKSKNRPVPK